ncbi:MAG TPA: hypothetical protein VGW38_17170, partial [Chloroflexota bacterium]|nr:hypothetical protein [Chloroflexota bacterium]
LAGLLWWWQRSPAWNPTPAIVAEAVIAEPGAPTAQDANQLSLSGRSVLLANAVGSQRFGRLAVAGGIAYVLDSEGRIIAAPSAPASGQAAAVPVVPDQQVIDVVTRGTDVLVLERNGMINQLDHSGGVFRTFPVAGAAQWQRPVAAAIYATNLYVLDAGSPEGVGQIWRHNGDADGGFGAGAQPWLQATSPVVSSDATGFAIDGDIWLSKADGTVIKLTNGRADPLKLTGLETPIQVAGAVYTQREFRSLYVLDAAARRLVRFAKDGRYESQVAEVFPAGEHPRGLWVDEPNGRALILTDVRLQEVVF